jgi:hypothetical protein
MLKRQANRNRGQERVCLYYTPPSDTVVVTQQGQLGMLPTTLLAACAAASFPGRCIGRDCRLRSYHRLLLFVYINSFLEAALACVDANETHGDWGDYMRQPTWKGFAEFLYGGKVYE